MRKARQPCRRCPAEFLLEWGTLPQARHAPRLRIPLHVHVPLFPRTQQHPRSVHACTHTGFAQLYSHTCTHTRTRTHTNTHTVIHTHMYT